MKHILAFGTFVISWVNMIRELQVDLAIETLIGADYQRLLMTLHLKIAWVAFLNDRTSQSFLTATTSRVTFPPLET